MARINLNFRKSAALILDQKGFDKIVDNLAEKNRVPALKKAIGAGSSIVLRTIRSIYKNSKPESELDRGIVRHMFPSGEGAVVRRFYIKGGMGKNYDSSSPIYRSYILNFWEKGTKDRVTKGKGMYKAGARRGKLPALKFFSRARNRAKKPALREIERILLTELANQARKA